MNHSFKKAPSLVKITLFFLFSLVVQMLWSQMESEGKPLYSFVKSNNEIPFFQVDADVLENFGNDMGKGHANQKKMAIARNLHFKMDVLEQGKWTDLNGFMVCQLGIYAQGAKSLGLTFERFILPRGAKVFVLNAERAKGAFTERNHKLHGGLTVSHLPGNKLVIELQIPKGKESVSELKIGQVSYGFAELSNGRSVDLFSQSCNVDVNCFDSKLGALTKKSVVKILANNEDYCTGTLINNLKNDNKPYLITANHCISNATEAQNSVFIFNHEKSDCNGYSFSFNRQISGAKLLATSSYIDFSLVELSLAPPYHYGPFYAGWDMDTTHLQNTYIIHHPSGDFKKISIDNDPPAISSYKVKGVIDKTFDPLAFWEIKQWDMGTTEGGSSGGPLFDQDFRLIGTLSGGDANCVENFNDYFARFDRSWNDYSRPENQLEVWLDPDNTGLTYCNGRLPFVDIDSTNYELGQIDGKNAYYETAGDWGCLSGHSSLNFNYFAEKFTVSDTASLLGFWINPAKIVRKSIKPIVRFIIWKGELEKSTASLVYQVDVPIEYFKENQWSFVPLDNFYSMDSVFYIGYQIFYSSYQNIFAMNHSAPAVGTSGNTAFVYHISDGWIPLYNAIGKENSTSLFIKAVLNDPDRVVAIPKNPDPLPMEIYPNPCDQYLFVKSPKPIDWIAVYNVNGMCVKYVQNTDGQKKVMVETQGLVNGIYFVQICAEKEVNFSKFIVRH
jgi:lysyl endopeptidase